MHGSDAWICVVGQERPGCPSVMTTQTGNVVGPTDDGLGFLSTDVPEACNTFDEVFTPVPSTELYQLEPTCNPWATSQPATNIALVPVIDSLCNGSCDVTILRFAMFYVEGWTCSGGGAGGSCEVTGRYVETSVDPSAYIGPLDPLGSVTFVRLIE
jgi:hypothetical protein